MFIYDDDMIMRGGGHEHSTCHSLAQGLFVVNWILLITVLTIVNTLKTRSSSQLRHHCWSCYSVDRYNQPNSHNLVTFRSHYKHQTSGADSFLS